VTASSDGSLPINPALSIWFVAVLNVTMLFPLLPARLGVAINNFGVPGSTAIALTGRLISRTPVETL